jgi:hypothetical protein
VRSKPKDVGRLRISLAQKKVFRSEAPLFCGEACATRARALQVRRPSNAGCTVLFVACVPLRIADNCRPGCVPLQVTLPEEAPLPVYKPPPAPAAAAAAPATPQAASASAAPSAPAASGADGAVTMAGRIIEHAAPQPDAGAAEAWAVEPADAARAAAAVEGFVPRSARHIQWADDTGAALTASAPAPAPAAAPLPAQQQPVRRQGPAPIVPIGPRRATPAQAAAAARPVDLPASLSYELPERLSASHYQAKLDRAMAGASARGDAAADAARDVTPPTAADEAADADADAEAFVRGWTDALAVVADAPDGAAAAAPRRAAATSAAPPVDAAAAAAASNGGATFYFDVLAEGTFGAGVRGDENDPSQPRGSTLTNMGQFSYGELKCVREAGDAGPDGDADEEEEEEEEAGVDAWEEDSAAEEEEEEEEEDDEEAEAEADEARRRVAQRVDAAGEASGSDSEREEDGGDGESDDSGVSGDSGDERRPGRTRAPKLPATRATLDMPGAHPLFEMPAKDMRPTLSPFLQARARAAAAHAHCGIHACSDDTPFLSVFFADLDGAGWLGYARHARLPGQPARRARIAGRRRRASAGCRAQHVAW